MDDMILEEGEAGLEGSASNSGLGFAGAAPRKDGEVATTLQRRPRPSSVPVSRRRDRGTSGSGTPLDEEEAGPQFSQSFEGLNNDFLPSFRTRHNAKGKL